MAFDMDAVEQGIRDHMSMQPYSAKCAECGADIILNVEVDGDLDLHVVVPICDCQKE